MSAQINTVISYTDANGDVPYEEWIRSLKDRKARAIIALRIDRLAVGNPGNSRDLGDGVFEMKIDFGPGYRVYVARSGKTVYLLLAGGDKSTQNADIKEAKKRWQEYKRRTAR